MSQCPEQLHQTFLVKRQSVYRSAIQTALPTDTYSEQVKLTLIVQIAVPLGSVLQACEVMPASDQLLLRVSIKHSRTFIRTVVKTGSPLIGVLLEMLREVKRGVPLTHPILGAMGLK